MNEIDDLISRIASEYRIVKGIAEDESAYKARVIYSLVGSTGLSAVLDVVEADEDISVIHVKKRMREMLDTFSDLYPDIVPAEDERQTEITENLLSLMQENGFFYHTPYRLLPAEDKTACLGNVRFERTVFSEGSCVSGIGRYRYLPCETGTIPEVLSLFHIDSTPLGPDIKHLIDGAVWTKEAVRDSDTEYLRMHWKDARNYWQRECDRSGKVSLLRKGQPGSRLYYLYKYNGEDIYLSRLPEWRSEGLKYLKIAAGLLAQDGKLPPVRAVRDGENVIISFGFLPAEDLLHFIRLYSWPEGGLVDSAFTRIMPAGLWEIFSRILLALGYRIGE